MKAEFSKDNENLIIKIPLKQEIHNPYSEEIEGQMDNIAGLITKDKDGNDKVGFVHLIDRSHKGKEWDISSIFFEYWGGKKEFEEICGKLGLDIYRI